MMRLKALKKLMPATKESLELRFFFKNFFNYLCLIPAWADP